VVPGILIQGCCVYTTYQTARTLAPGRVVPASEVGFGRAVADGEFPFMIDLGYEVRIGVVRNLDVGMRPLLLAADIKYQFLRGGMDGAFDLGVSYLPTVNLGIEYENTNAAFGLYPMVMFSHQRGLFTYSYGARLIYHQRSYTTGGFFGRSWSGHFLMPGAVLGLAIGRPSGKVRFSPEVSCYYCPPEGESRGLPLAFGGGFALQVGKRN
jgi:hypothetical protein